MRMHVNLRVSDLEASTTFYSSLFGAEPTVRKHDYAKWMLEEPRMNFAIVASGKASGLEHLGLQAESREELELLRERAGLAGLGVTHEGETTCCYARSDKSWVTDRQGIEWEMFYTHGAAEEPPTAARIPAATAAGTGCCEPGCCESEPAASGRAGRGA